MAKYPRPEAGRGESGDPPPTAGEGGANLAFDHLGLIIPSAVLRGGPRMAKYLAPPRGGGGVSLENTPPTAGEGRVNVEY